MQQRTTLTTIALVAAMISSTSAHAQAPGMVVDVPPQPRASGGSYTGALVTADAISLGLVLTGGVLIGEHCSFFGSDDDEPGCSLGGISAIFGLGGYLLASPIIHLSERRAGAAGLSLVLRVGGPLVAAGLGENDQPLLALAAFVSVFALDWAVLARPSRRRPEQRTSWAPVVAPTRGGAVAGLAIEM